MRDRVLDMLDRGEVRQAQQLAAGAPDFGLADLLEGWRLLRAGDPPGSEARLRPLVSHMERTPGAETRAQAHALLALGVATVLGGRGDAGTALLERAMGLHDAGWLHAQALRFCALALEQRGAWQRAARPARRGGPPGGRVAAGDPGGRPGAAGPRGRRVRPDAAGAGTGRGGGLAPRRQGWGMTKDQKAMLHPTTEDQMHIHL